MVKLTMIPLVALGLVVSVAATTLPARSSDTTFSWSNWVEDLIANPETALTPDEAVAAAFASSENPSAGSLDKRADCQAMNFRPANANDAAACLRDLADKGARGVQCRLERNYIEVYMCRIGSAEVVGVAGGSGPAVSVNCNDVARTGGLIFDSCWRADNTVQGSERCISEPALWVHIAGR